MDPETITFSFGENWSKFIQTVSEEDISRAAQDIVAWIGQHRVEGKRIIDVGSGSGIHSLAFAQLGAKYVHSFDYDPLSVQATRELWKQAGAPVNWAVEQGSVLDSDYLTSLGEFDIVYSWGVLHHTGAMWNAISNCAALTAPGGLLWISIYAKGPRYTKDLALKKRFNSASDLGKRWMIWCRIVRQMRKRVRQGKNPFAWNQHIRRGMNTYHDIVDWLGGLPYETATEDEVVRFLRERGGILERIAVAPEGGCSKYVFSVPQGAELRHSIRPSRSIDDKIPV